MRMPFIDLKTPYLYWEQDIRARIDKVLEHGRFIMGPEVEELEEKLAGRVGVGHAVSCASGTDALIMGLMSLGIGAGDAVFTTPFTFVATAEAIALCGATPVFVDIDPATYNIDPDKLEQAVEALKANDTAAVPLPTGVDTRALKPKGIMTVDLFGLPTDYDRIHALAKKHSLYVIEDGAQSFGGAYKEVKTGALGDVGCTSFFPAKPLGCFGDGGAVFTDNDQLAAKLRSIRNHGSGKDKYDTVQIGINGRLDTLQAAVLLIKLMGFDAEMSNRQHLSGLYTRLLNERCPAVTTPVVPKGCVSAWAQYSIQADGREAIQSSLADQGIPTAVYYPKPLHLQKAYAYLGYKPGDMEIAEAVAERIFSLPMHPYLSDVQVEEIVDAVCSAVAANG